MKRLCSLFAVLALASFANASSLTESLKKGSPDLKSAGALAFGPDGVLFVGDSIGAAVFAFGTGDVKGDSKEAVNIEKIDDKIASLIGSSASDITINDLKVNPASGNLYFSVSRGKGAKGEPVLVKADRAGKLTALDLKTLPFAKAALPNPNAKQPGLAITGLSFADNKLIVAGLSSEEFASTLRMIPVPFKDAEKGSGVEIYHGAHGKFETNAPIRTFTLYEIAGEQHLLAAYTCTPLVKIPLKDLKPGEKVKGATVAELGNRNTPLDMVTYKKGAKEYVLLTNTARGVMKITTEGIDKIVPITNRVADKAGLSYETVKNLEGVVQLDKLDAERAVLILKNGANFDLQTIELP